MKASSPAQSKRSAPVRSEEMPCNAMATSNTPKRVRRAPKMGRHSSGQARITLGGKVHYLGEFGTPEAYEKYAQLVRQWEANGRQAVDRTPNAVQATLRIGDLLDQYRASIDARGRYQKNGRPTSQRAYIDNVCNALKEHAGSVPVTRTTEATLVAWRENLEQDQKLTRGGINRKVTMAVQAFRWGKSRGLVPKSVWAEVSSLEPLRRGEVGDRPEKGRPRRAVTADEVAKVAEHAAPQVAAMLTLQSLTGMRPGEVCGLRWADIDQKPVDGDGLGCWLYRVASAKTAHHGHETRYLLPPAAQRILLHYKALPTAYVFSPRTAMEERRNRLREARQTPPTQQMRDRDATPAREYANRWDINQYRRACLRACERAGIEPFTPHEVRHGFVTWAANNLSLGAAAMAANHRNVTTTQRYVHVHATDALSVAAAVEKRASGS